VGRPWYQWAVSSLGDRLWLEADAAWQRKALGPAHDALARLIQQRDFPRPHEAWLRLGEVHAARGHLRRALGAFRRAQEVDRRGESTKVTFQAVGALTHVLHQHQRFILHVFDEAARSRALEAGVPLITRDTPREPLSMLAARARALRRDLREAAHTALDAIAELADAKALLPKWTDQSPCSELEQHGGEEGRALAASWRVAQAELYEELLEREEPLFDAATPSGAAQQAAAARRWDEAFGGLERELGKDPELVGLLAEAWGDRLARLDEPAAAERFYAQAQAAHERFASRVTSGGEGAARMLAVERVRAKRAA